MKINTVAKVAGVMPYLFDVRELWNHLASLSSRNILNFNSEVEETKEENIAIQECNSQSFSSRFSFLGCINMKKAFALIALVTALSNVSFAQIANLNITLSDVLSFSVTQPGSLDVNFDTEEKYTNGITAFATDHVSVTSSKGYIVKAVAGTVTGLAALSPGTVKITSTVGATNNGNITGITYSSAVILPVTGGAAATVISAANTSWSGSNSTNKFNISYLIGSGGAYAGKPIGLNVVPVVYTVTQQ